MNFSGDFFINNEVLFIGIQNKYRMFAESVCKSLIKKGIRVFPVSCSDVKMKFKCFNNIDEIANIPESVYSILDTEDNRSIISELKNKGVKRILFHSRRIVDKDILDRCRDSSIEVAVACPLMVYGSFPHRIHGFIAGIK